ncbi:MAG: rod shape-determining protein RodA [Candidatus Cloacimonetes bacterium]|nr:rod shape-determining protein RodA [Candidatus Cloacimonadota bacterium]
MVGHMRNFDWKIFILLICLLIFGVISIYSASSRKIGTDIQTQDYYLKQICWIIISIILLFILLRIPYAVIDLIIIPAYIITILLLIIVLFMPEIKGSQRWIILGPIHFQPSELAKLVTIMLVSKIISKPHLTGWKIISRSFPVVLLPTFLILLEPDLGTALILIVSLFIILAVSELSGFYLILIISPILSIITSFSPIFFIIYIILLILILYKINLSKIVIGFTAVVNIFFFFITPVFWNSLKEYQQNRILSFINPMRDPFGSGYQIIQAKIAIGSGGLLGKGFLAGTQKNLNFLPEHHTDFIFSVIGEEFGFLGCMFLLLLLFLFLYFIVRKIALFKRKEYKYTVVGILAYFAFQIFINVGMNIGIMPTTGIPLPFISYGGSNLFINILSVGIILKYLTIRSIFK